MMEYDGAGHRTKLIDPDAGTQTATYAADGTLLSETDGRGIVTTYSYDNLGRVMTKMCGDIIETTAYGTSGYGLNRIVSIARNNGRREEFEYDRFGRVIVDTRYDDNKTFEISYEYYDNTGFLKKKSYPGGIAVTYTYDSNGNVMSATANGKRYFQQGVYNGRENNIYFGSLSLKETFYHNKTLVANQILRYGTVELDLPYIKGSAKKFDDETFESFEGVYNLWGYQYTDERKEELRRLFVKNGGDLSKIRK